MRTPTVNQEICNAVMVARERGGTLENIGNAFVLSDSTIRNIVETNGNYEEYTALVRSNLDILNRRAKLDEKITPERKGWLHKLFDF